MGARTVTDWLKQAGFDLPESSMLRPVRMGIDVPLVVAASALIIFGLLMVYSASADFGYTVQGNELYYLQRQLQWVLIGLVVAAGAALVKYQIWRRLALPAMLVSIILLALLLLVGESRHGAVRGLLSGSIQPSELAKIVMVFYLAIWLFNRRDQMKDVWLGLVPLGIILGVVGGLILRQPDLSAVITIGLVGGLMFFLAGGDLRQIIILMVLGIGVGFLLYNMTDTARIRIDDFIAGIKNALEAHPHVQRSLEAFSNGGWFGVGIGKSQTKVTGLPFPHTDSIFAVVGEETGVLGAVALIIGYLVILWRGIGIASRTQDGLGRILAAGLTFWLVLEAFVNMAVMVGLMPFAGNALPFISSGGSNMVVSLAAIGTLLNISRQVEQNQEKEERTFDTIVNLRRGDRRGRVSRPVRPSGVVARK